jgi:alpha-glucosidase
MHDMGWPSWAFSNHDAPRAISRWARPEDRAAFARLAMLLLISLRGNVFLYEGEELGLPQAHIDFEDLKDPEAIANWPLTLGRDGARTPMPWKAGAAHAGFSTGKPWLPVPADHQALAVDRQEGDSTSQLALTRRLIELRKRTDALRTGTMRVVEASKVLLAFERKSAHQHLLCAFNLGAQAHHWQPGQPEQWRVIESVGDASAWRFPPLSGLIAERVS